MVCYNEDGHGLQKAFLFSRVDTILSSSSSRSTMEANLGMWMRSIFSLSFLGVYLAKSHRYEGCLKLDARMARETSALASPLP